MGTLLFFGLLAGLGVLGYFLVDGIRRYRRWKNRTNRQLWEVIEDAPHDLGCLSIRRVRHVIDGTEPGDCTCWKSAARVGEVRSQQ